MTHHTHTPTGEERVTAAGPPSSSPPIVKTSREALARQLLSRIRSDVAALEALLAHAPIPVLVDLVDVQQGGDGRVRISP